MRGRPRPPRSPSAAHVERACGLALTNSTCTFSPFADIGEPVLSAFVFDVKERLAPLVLFQKNDEAPVPRSRSFRGARLVPEMFHRRSRRSSGERLALGLRHGQGKGRCQVAPWVFSLRGLRGRSTVTSGVSVRLVLWPGQEPEQDVGYGLFH